MPERQQPNSGNSRPKCSLAARIAAAVVFAGILSSAVVLWLSAKGHIQLGFWLGVCGFKQRYGLPCPGCGWTHAIEALLTGHPVDAFIIQPAAVFFCVVAAAAGFYALLIAVVGIDFSVLKRLGQAVGVNMLVAGVFLLIAMGWLVTLLRAMIQKGGS